MRDGPADGEGEGEGDGDLLGRLVGDGEPTGRFVGEGVAAGCVGAGLRVFCWPGAAVRSAGDAVGKGRTSR